MIRPSPLRAGAFALALALLAAPLVLAAASPPSLPVPAPWAQEASATGGDNQTDDNGTGGNSTGGNSTGGGNQTGGGHGNHTGGNTTQPPSNDTPPALDPPVQYEEAGPTEPVYFWFLVTNTADVHQRIQVEVEEPAGWIVDIYAYNDTFAPGDVHAVFGKADTLLRPAHRDLVVTATGETGQATAILHVCLAALLLDGCTDHHVQAPPPNGTEPPTNSTQPPSNGTEPPSNDTSAARAASVPVASLVALPQDPAATAPGREARPIL